MATKRGRKPQGPYADKSSVLTTRITTELREKLDRARKQHPEFRSLSQEVEHRLRRSFNEDEPIKELFGSKEAYAIARLVTFILDAVEGQTQRHWAENAFTVQTAGHAIAYVLAEFKGSDDEGVPEHLAGHYAGPRDAGEGTAKGLLFQLSSASDVPIDKPGRYYSKQAKDYPHLMSALGELGERLK